MSTLQGMDLPRIQKALSDLPISPISSILLGIVLLVVHFIREGYKIDLPKVPKIPIAPGSYPFIGHLVSLSGHQKLSDAIIFSRWGVQLSSGVFQIGFGSQRNIIFGS
ncbi:hypothetical protein BDZ45DRAFT_740157 [Acephala macrosclerotiorum]|nr:hypothetical protein BDZ45DRAFT_740157 [Acephala macrosclerotiorum]